MGCFEGKEPDIGSGLSFSLSHEERKAALRVTKPQKRLLIATRSIVFFIRLGY